MAITKETLITQINVDEYGNVGVRESTRIVEDGVVLSETYHRHVVDCGADLTGQDQKVQAIANATWTPELIAAAEARRAAAAAAAIIVPNPQA
jgi:hypothetical protein